MHLGAEDSGKVLRDTTRGRQTQMNQKALIRTGDLETVDLTDISCVTNKLDSNRKK